MFFWRSWKNPQRTINLEPNYVVVVTPEQYIEMYKGERDNIDSVSVVPGVLGSDYFGGFLVRRKRPVYTPLAEPEFTR